MVLSSIIGAVFGCVVGYKKYSRMDNYITTGFIAINAVPIFFLAMVMVTIFSFKLDIFPLGGLSSVRVPNTFWGAVLDRIWHLILPVATITLVSIPMKFLVVRNSVAAAKDEKYVVYAKSRGVSDWRIKFIHIFKNVSQPFITIVGLNLGFAISGSMITEVIFSINGMGSLIYDAAIFRDYPTLQGSFLVISVMVILANILTDLLCIMIDPRQREGTYDEN